MDTGGCGAGFPLSMDSRNQMFSKSVFAAALERRARWLLHNCTVCIQVFRPSINLWRFCAAVSFLGTTAWRVSSGKLPCSLPGFPFSFSGSQPCCAPDLEGFFFPSSDFGFFPGGFFSFFGVFRGVFLLGAFFFGVAFFGVAFFGVAFFFLAWGCFRFLAFRFCGDFS